jgi:hypothetical protein
MANINARLSKFINFHDYFSHTSFNCIWQVIYPKCWRFCNCIAFPKADENHWRTTSSIHILPQIKPPNSMFLNVNLAWRSWEHFRPMNRTPGEGFSMACMATSGTSLRDWQKWSTSSHPTGPKCLRCRSLWVSRRLLHPGISSLRRYFSVISRLFRKAC